MGNLGIHGSNELWRFDEEVARSLFDCAGDAQRTHAAVVDLHMLLGEGELRFGGLFGEICETRVGL